MNGMTEKQEQNRRVNNGKDFCTGQNDKEPFAMQEFYPLTQTQSQRPVPLPPLREAGPRAAEESRRRGCRRPSLSECYPGGGC